MKKWSMMIVTANALFSGFQKTRNDMKLGFEYEILVAGKPDIYATEETVARRLNRVNLDGWQVVNDPSVGVMSEKRELVYDSDPSDIVESNVNWIGKEFVSPTFSYSEINSTFRKFNQKLKSFKQLQFMNNNSTSNHVHISSPKFRWRFFNSVLKKIDLAWLYFEPLFVFLVSANRRKCEYCVSNFNYRTDAYINRYIDLNAPLSNFGKKCFHDEIHDVFQGKIYNVRTSWLYQQRFQALNIYPSMKKHGTIEVRLKHGSNDMEANARWVEILVTFFAAVVKNNFVTNIYDTYQKTQFYHRQRQLLRNRTFSDMDDMNKLLKQLKEFIRQVSDEKIASKWCSDLKAAFPYRKDLNSDCSFVCHVQ